jgi:hypothetical protein
VSHAPAPADAGPGALRAVLAALVLALGLVLPAGVLLTAPSAEASAACDGVTVRVERSGSVRDRCAPGSPRNGLYALREAGYRYTEVPGQPGMVCTIDGHPEPCNGAPADAYWSYWHAEAGATSWTYATRGAASRTPAKGSHEAWVFGAGAPPSAPPPAPPAEPAPEPSPSPSPSPSPTTPPRGSGGGGGAGGSSGPGGSSPGAGPGGGSGSGGATAPRGSDAGSASGERRGGGASGGDAAARGPSEDATAPPAVPDADGRSEDPPGAEPSTDGTAEADDADDAQDGAPDEDDEPPSDEALDGEAEERGPIALDDTVEIDAPGSGGGGLAAVAGGALVLGLGAAGLVRARRRGDDLGSGA